MRGGGESRDVCAVAHVVVGSDGSDMPQIIGVVTDVLIEMHEGRIEDRTTAR